ncbi:MAG TPA: hypothetical protein VM370_02010 [Candidatus Thermoplasmatota archaeon]|nr:hypothetical protein [Candidatus Thermoplasmatota archaeon]
MRAVAVLLVLLAGCATPTGAQTAHVDPPPDGEWSECPPAQSRPIGVPFRAEATNDTAGHGPGIHRLDARTFLWVYAEYEETLREDRVSRLNAVDVARSADAVLHVCTRVDLATPTQVDAEPRSYAVAARLTAQEPLPEGRLRVVVNWIAGCRCEPAPRGNATALFD